MVLFCNLVCVYVHKICDDKFGSCMKSFSWLGQKVNKKIDAYGHDADDSDTALCPWSRDDAVSRQDIKPNLKPLNICILFNSYSKFRGYLIQFE